MAAAALGLSACPVAISAPVAESPGASAASKGVTLAAAGELPGTQTSPTADPREIGVVADYAGDRRLRDELDKVLFDEPSFVVFPPPSFAVDPPTPLDRAAAASVAIVRSKHIEPHGIETTTVRESIAFDCCEKCYGRTRCLESDLHEQIEHSPDLEELIEQLGSLRAVARGGGVMIADGVVATAKHILNKPWPEAWSVVVNFTHDQPAAWAPFEVRRLCKLDPPNTESRFDVALLVIEPGDHADVLPEPLDVGDAVLVGNDPVSTFAIGHPLGSTRVFSGPEGTSIRRCSHQEPGHADNALRATIDAFQHSSGSPVFVPSSSDGDPLLFGLVHNDSLALPDFTCAVTPLGTVCDYHRVEIRSADDICDNGTIITPLAWAVAPAKALATGTIPNGWRCRERTPEPKPHAD